MSAPSAAAPAVPDPPAPTLHERDAWLAMAASIDRRPGLFAGGEWTGSRDGTEVPVTSPRDGAVIAHVLHAGVADVDAAVAAARAAFDHGPWPRMLPRERGQALLRFADLVERDREHLALLISLEMGKPIRDSLLIETRAVAATLRFYGELADKSHGEVTRSSGQELGLVTREPAGVVAAVVPWNFPLTLAAWKLGPALAAGCTVVLKPAEQSPLSALRLAGLAQQAGLPPGVLNVVSGDGPTAGRRLGEHPGVDVLTFTGSPQVGRKFLRYAADSNLKRVWLELGGKSPNIVFADAPDLDAAADAAAWAIFFNAGEMCTAGSRLLVERPVAEALTEKVIARAAEYTPGDPLDPATRMGPVVDRAQQERILAYVDSGRAEGARLRAGGRVARAASGGTYLEPTVFDQVAPGMTIAREEVFGPLLSVIAFDDPADAVRLANDSDYGLAAGVWTADLGRAHRTARELRAGTVWVNCYEEGDLTVPFGGVKMSGHGRDKSAHALEKFTDLKTTWLALP